MSVGTRLSLRARLTAIATVVAVLGLTLGGIVMVISLQRALLASVDESARGDAGDIAALVDANRLTDPLPTFGAAVAQVVDGDGRVRASTPGGDRLAPIVGAEDLAAVSAGEAVEIDGTRLGDPAPYRVVGQRAGPPDDRQIVLVAVSLAEHRRGSKVVRTAVPLIGAGLTIGMAALTWFGVGRALRPVEQLRAGAAEITGTGGVGPLPVPGADDEIRRLAVTLNDMLARLEEASARQRTFVADAAHELRSPIAAMRTELEVALAHPDQVDPHETAREALHEVGRMGRLVDDLLVLARADDRRHRPAHTEFDLRDCASAEAARAVSSRAGVGENTLRNVTVGVAEGAPVQVTGDRASLERAVRNLLENAVRHARTRVRVDVQRFAHEAELTVEDDGPGVPVADRDRIFDRFARLDDARARDDGGTGLGLAIVREIARAHDGTVRVEDARPGARFVLRLPR